MIKRIRTFVVLGCALALVLGMPAASQAADRVTIRNVDTSDFPDVKVALSIRRDATSEQALALFENEQPITDLQTTKLSESGEIVEVVLAVDTSGSMIGPPMAAAIDAASSFIRSLPDEIRVGVVAFSSSPQTLVRPTTDHASALSAVRGLAAHGETALYDAIEHSASLFSGGGQPNIVLLSDGGDTVSAAGLQRAISRAQNAEAAVFAVGLRTPETDFEALRKLATETGGRWSRADTADLEEVYANVARELRGQMLISYRSQAPAETEVALRVESGAGADSALFLTPIAEMPIPSLPDPTAEPPILLEGRAGLLLAVGLTFAAILVILWMLLGAGMRNRRRHELAKKVALETPRPSIDADPSEEEREERSRSWIPVPVTKAAEKLTGGSDLSAKIDRLLERAGSPLKPAELLGTVALAWLGGSFVGLMLGGIGRALILGLLGSAIPYVWVRIRVRGRTAAIKAQLPDVVGLLASSLRAGHSFFQAVAGVAREMGPPADHEFSRAVAEVRLGRPLDEALTDLADRIGSEDFKWALMAVNIQHEVGGNLAEVLDTVAATLRERDDIRRQVKVLSAEGRLSAYVLSGLPFLVLGWFWLVNRDALDRLFSHGVGRTMMFGALTLLLIGASVMKRMVRIDV